MTHIGAHMLAVGDDTCRCLIGELKQRKRLPMKATITTMNTPITRETLLSYPDGTWIMTDDDITTILDIAHWKEPMPISSSLNGWWWRRKQLMDQLGMWT